ncbi:hypothetical protein, partial [Burkholderia cepacia]|uniref:hypothetical protein n=1 Tax=Burkholderia cepacia TaxID=292 RepID=UPI0013F41729
VAISLSLDGLADLGMQHAAVLVLLILSLACFVAYGLYAVRAPRRRGGGRSSHGATAGVTRPHRCRRSPPALADRRASSYCSGACAIRPAARPSAIRVVGEPGAGMRRSSECSSTYPERFAAARRRASCRISSAR